MPKKQLDYKMIIQHVGALTPCIDTISVKKICSFNKKNYFRKSIFHNGYYAGHYAGIACNRTGCQCYCRFNVAQSA